MTDPTKKMSKARDFIARGKKAGHDSLGFVMDEKKPLPKSPCPKCIRGVVGGLPCQFCHGLGLVNRTPAVEPSDIGEGEEGRYEMFWLKLREELIERKRTVNSEDRAQAYMNVLELMRLYEAKLPVKELIEKKLDAGLQEWLDEADFEYLDELFRNEYSSRELVNIAEQLALSKIEKLK